MEECCRNCKHHKRETKDGIFVGWVCANEDADEYGLFTDSKYVCQDHEERNK